MERARAAANRHRAGAFVAIDPRNGQILAIGSQPSYDPNKFAKPLTPPEYEALIGQRLGGRPAHQPGGQRRLPDRLDVQADHGDGGARRRRDQPRRRPRRGPVHRVGAQQFCNAGRADYGAVGLVKAMKVSSDTYFYHVGERANRDGDVIQNGARARTRQARPGSTSPASRRAWSPTRRWRQRGTSELACDSQHHVASCAISASAATGRVGDNMDLAVGQGDLQTDPLQMAVAYSTLANAFMDGGTGAVVTPHLGKEIDESTGGQLQSLSFPPRRHVHLNYPTSLVMEGIHEAASSRGHPAEVWTGWDQSAHPVYGKTGTAQQRAGRPVLVHGLHRRPPAADRDRRDGRAGRLRRGNGRAGARLMPRSGSGCRTSSWRGARRPSDEPLERRSSHLHRSAGATAATASPDAARAAPAVRSAADARCARPRRVLDRHPQGRDAH